MLSQNLHYFNANINTPSRASNLLCVCVWRQTLVCMIKEPKERCAKRADMECGEHQAPWNTSYYSCYHECHLVHNFAGFFCQWQCQWMTSLILLGGSTIILDTKLLIPVLLNLRLSNTDLTLSKKSQKGYLLALGGVLTTNLTKTMVWTLNKLITLYLEKII